MTSDSAAVPAHPAYGQLRQVTTQAAVLLADNPGPMTLDGTNTWLLRGRPDRDSAVVVDPGPDSEHLDRVLSAAGRVELIVLTHGHPDHSAGAARLSQHSGAEVRCVSSSFRTGDALADGEVVTAAGLRMRVWHTPGHTADSICLLVGEDGAAAVLTGDTILGRGTTVIAEPDGSLADYLESLRRLSRLDGLRALPGHGPDLPDVANTARAYLEHRALRLRQIREALAELGQPADVALTDAVVSRVYGDVPPDVLVAAAQSVRAQLAYLAATAS